MFSRLRNRYLFVIDIILLGVAAYISFVLRLEEYGISDYWQGFLYFTVIVEILTLSFFTFTGLYSRYWPYASVDELVLLFIANALATCSTAVIVLSPGLVGQDRLTIPHSVPFIFLLLATIFTATPRYAVRLAAHISRRMHRVTIGTPTIIAGAGHAGEMIMRELKQHPRSHTHVIGFVDDDPVKQGTRIHGLPVLGLCNEITDLAARFDVQQVIIAMPDAPGKDIRNVVERCDSASIKTLIVPAIYQLLDRKVSFNQLREVRIEDLLRRDQIQTDIAAVQTLIHGRRVLVTGGGGSIGSELCRQVLSCRPSMLIILGHGENSVFEIHNEIQRLLYSSDNDQPPVTLVPIITDIRFLKRLQKVFAQYKPEIVFHAAAHKHVPLMEYNSPEAITTNVLGTRNLLQAALETDVERFVMISSDKAVNPTSVMGASKRVAELLVHQAARQSKRSFMAVRFGNVLGSRGSVVLTFKRQIAAGGPITITHPDMQRFFMTIPEAVQLVLQASVLGQGSETFMLDMGEPVKIIDLARDMIELSGLEVGRDIEIVSTGIRPGEKLYEELFVPGEVYRSTIHPKVFIAHNDSSYVPTTLDAWIEALASAAERDDTNAIIWILRNLIPQHQLSQKVNLTELEEQSIQAPLLLAHTVGL